MFILAIFSQLWQANFTIGYICLIAAIEYSIENECRCINHLIFHIYLNQNRMMEPRGDYGGNV